MYTKAKSIIENRGHWIVFFGVLALSLLVAIYVYNLDRYSLIYFGDSVSHMVSSRKIIDWMDPGLKQIGTVWLPLPHLLLLPFTMIDHMFTAGFAGTAVSLPSLVVSSVLLYKMVKNKIIAGSSLAALVSAFLYASNANILYMGITAMTEAPFMLFFVTSAYYFLKWQLNSYQSKNLLYCSIFISLATVCRYEAWILPMFVIPFAALHALRRKVSEGNVVFTILLSIISISGIVFWLSYNAYQYGNPIEFVNAKYYSAVSQAISRPFRESLFFQPITVLTVYTITALSMYGPVVLVSALIGYIADRRLQEDSRIQRLSCFLVLPPLYTIFTLLIGIGEMTYWFNSRFLILLSPLIAVSIALLLKRLPMRVKKSHRTLAIVIGALFIFQLASPVFGVITYLDAKNGFFYKLNPYAVKAGEALGSMYDHDDGSIMMLTGSVQEHRIMVTSGIHLRQFDEITESSMWKKSFYQPWLFDKWLVISKDPDSDALKTTKYWSDERRNELNEHYKRIYENQYYDILILK